MGEALVDVVRTDQRREHRARRGSAANVAVALARLGRRVRFATSYADDAHGRSLADHLRRAGVEQATDPIAVPRTSTAVAQIAPDGSATYAFDLHWRLNPVDPGDPVVVHVCSLGAVVEPGCHDVVDLLARLRGRATVSYDVNARPAATGRSKNLVERVERVVALSDVVKVSDEDLEALWPDLEQERAVARLLDLGAVAVTLTRGAQGAVWCTPGRRVTVGARPVSVVDTIGAGDTFAAGLLDALWSRGRLGGDRAALADLVDDEITAVLGHATEGRCGHGVPHGG